MRTLAPALLLSLALPQTATAQLQEGDLLVNSINQAALFHMEDDGSVVVNTTGETGFLWEGAGVLPDGRWVTTHRYPDPGVSIFDPATGAEASHFDTPLVVFPGDVSVFSDGTFLVADQNQDALVHYDELGNHLGTIALPAGCHPLGTCVDGNDEVWVGCVDTQEVLHYDSAGNSLGGFATGHDVGEVAPSSDGTLWVSDYDTGTIVHYDAAGAVLGSFMGSSYPATALAIAPDGTLWVGGATEANLRHFDPSGGLLGEILSPVGTTFLFIAPAADDGPPLGDSYCGPSQPNSTGNSGVIVARGSDVVADNDVTVEASRLPAHQFGYFLTSQTQGWIPNPGGSQGNLCLTGSIGRYDKFVASTGQNGVITLKIDLTKTPTPPGPVAILAGETWNWTAWYRDTNPTPTSNFTQGVSITFQ